jgi:hypothetical protein
MKDTIFFSLSLFLIRLRWISPFLFLDEHIARFQQSPKEDVRENEKSNQIKRPFPLKARSKVGK